MASLISSQPAPCDEALLAHQTAMIKACKSGDLDALQQLFKTYHVTQGSRPIYRNTLESGPPATLRMIEAAVSQKRRSIVAFLLFIYPDVSLWISSIIQAVLDNPDLETLKILHAHSPSIVSYEFYPMTTFLTAACQSSEDWLISYLIDSGADLHNGWCGGALYAALQFSRSFDLIKQMVDKGGYVSGTIVNQAICQQRPDVLGFFFSDSRIIHNIDHDVKEPEKFLKLAYEKENKEVIALVKDYIKKRERRAKRRSKQARRVQKEECEGGEKGTIAEKLWWQFWKSGNKSKFEEHDGSEMESSEDLVKKYGVEKLRKS